MKCKFLTVGTDLSVFNEDGKLIGSSSPPEGGKRISNRFYINWNRNPKSEALVTNNSTQEWGNLFSERKPKIKKLGKELVDFKLLKEAAQLIFQAGVLYADDPDECDTDEDYQKGLKAVNNLDLFLTLMSNVNFATKASFELKKV